MKLDITVVFFQLFINLVLVFVLYFQRRDQDSYINRNGYEKSRGNFTIKAFV